MQFPLVLEACENYPSSYSKLTLYKAEHKIRNGLKIYEYGNLNSNTVLKWIHRHWDYTTLQKWNVEVGRENQHSREFILKKSTLFSLLTWLWKNNGYFKHNDLCNKLLKS